MSVLPPTRRAWLVVAALWFVACFNYLTRSMLPTMHGSIVGAFQINETQFGLLISVFLWVYGLLSPFAGFIADRFSRSRVILFSMAAWSLTTWATAYARNFEELLGLRVLLAVSEACYIPAGLALIVDYHRGPTRSLAIGIHMTGLMFGTALGGLGGWLAEQRSWSYAFALVGMVGIAYCGLLLLILRDSPKERSGESRPRNPDAGDQLRFTSALASLFSRGSFILAIAFWGLLGFSTGGLHNWMPAYFKEHFGLSQGAAGFSATAYSGGAAVLGVLIGGAWADRWNQGNSRGRIFVAAIGLGIAVPSLLVAAKTDVLTLAIIGLCLGGLSKSFSDSNMMPILCLVCNPRYRATGYGLLNAFGTISGGLAVYAGGALRDRQVNINAMFTVCATILLLCLALLLLIKPQKEV